MKHSATSYVRPADLDQAWELLRQGRELARPSWIGPYPDQMSPAPEQVLVDPRDLNISYIDSSDPARIRIGSATPLRDVADSQALATVFDGIVPTAFRMTANHGLRNLASLGGALESPQGAPEIWVSLLACRAEIVWFSGSKEKTGLQEYLRQRAQVGPHLLLEAALDGQLGRSGTAAICRVGRTPMDRAIVAAAAALMIEQGAIQEAAVAVAGDGLEPTRLPDLEATLVGTSSSGLSKDQVELTIQESISPQSSFRASSEYQAHLASLLAWRALQEALSGEGSR